jgi:hypothetical protein
MMYKKLLLSITVISLLAGCQGTQTANPDDVLKMTQNQERRIGVLQSLGGAYTSTQATHLLRMEDGKNIYLKSDVVKLSDDKYLNREVEVMGQIVRTTDGKQVITVNSIDMIDTESTTDDELPQWIDYDSDILALNLKYRDDYMLSESHSEIKITKRLDLKEAVELDDTESDLSSDLEMATISLERLSTDPKELANSMKVTSLDSADILAGGFTRSKVTQKAIDAYKKAVSSTNELYYYLKISSGVYMISFTAGDNIDDLVSEQNMFYDILASIDFHGGSIVIEDSESEDDIGDLEDELDDDDGGVEVSIKKVDDGEEEVDSDISEVDDDEEVESPVEDLDESIDVQSLGDELTGFSTFSSESAGFSVQYPKSYYFASAALSSGASRSYEFGGEPLEENPGDILLDILRGEVPDGKSTSYGGVAMTSVKNGSIVSIYVENNDKVFKLTGPSTKEGMLKQMASTIDN